MSAAPQQRPTPHPAGDSHTATAGETYGPPTALTGAYNPERQFLGSLMWLTAEQARPLLIRVPDTAIWHPRSRWAYELIRGLVDAGADPDPVSVLVRGRHHAARNSLDAGAPPSPHQHKQLALFLFDIYAQAVAPAITIVSYAQDVLDEAYRRAFNSCGIRMQQLAACPGADRDDMAKQLTAIRDELASLYRRAQTASDTATPHNTAHSTPR